MPVEAKAKVKERHRLAIAHYHKWRRDHPKATLAERVRTFDFLVDSAKLGELINE